MKPFRLIQYHLKCTIELLFHNPRLIQKRLKYADASHLCRHFGFTLSMNDRQLGMFFFEKDFFCSVFHCSPQLITFDVQLKEKLPRATATIAIENVHKIN